MFDLFSCQAGAFCLHMDFPESCVVFMPAQLQETQQQPKRTLLEALKCSIGQGLGSNIVTTAGQVCLVCFRLHGDCHASACVIPSTPPQHTTSAHSLPCCPAGIQPAACPISCRPVAPLLTTCIYFFMQEPQEPAPGTPRQHRQQAKQVSSRQHVKSFTRKHLRTL